MGDSVMGKRRLVLLLLLLSVVFATFGCGPSGETASRPAVSDDASLEATRILKKMCDYISGAEALSFEVQGHQDEWLETGQLAQFKRTSRVVAVRPGLLKVETDSGLARWSVRYHKGVLVLWNEKENLYAAEKLGGNLDKVFDHLQTQYNVLIPGHDLLVEHPYDSLSAHAQNGEYLGEHRVGEYKCHHLLFRAESVDWQVWIDAGDEPLPRKLVITYKLEPGQPQYEAVIDNWNLAPRVSAKDFAFTPPTGARETTVARLLEHQPGVKP
jgi:hypothetical protein